MWPRLFLAASTSGRKSTYLDQVWAISIKAILTAIKVKLWFWSKQVIQLFDQKRKRVHLSFVIRSDDLHQVLVFTRTKHGSTSLASQREKDGISATAAHGNKSQGARTPALKEFKQNKAFVAANCCKSLNTNSHQSLKAQSTVWVERVELGGKASQFRS